MVVVTPLGLDKDTSIGELILLHELPVDCQISALLLPLKFFPLSSDESQLKVIERPDDGALVELIIHLRFIPAFPLKFICPSNPVIRVTETAPKSSVPEEIITPMLPQVEDELPIGREREKEILEYMRSLSRRRVLRVHQDLRKIDLLLSRSLPKK